MSHHVYCEYTNFDGADFFTVVLLPNETDRFPTVVCRSPYVQGTIDLSESELLEKYATIYRDWLDGGYAVVYQHCRGQGKSSGAFVPYVHEREDGLALQDWIRKQPFYNGELFLLGGSYTASLHYTTTPFEVDIRGAVFEVQDTERYRLWYRNGQMRKGHANWHFWLYKDKCGLNKTFDMQSFSQLPLQGLSERVLHDAAEDFEQMLEAPSPEDAFWSTRFGGSDAKNATDGANIPLLLTTGYNDFYVGGIFKMWNRMNEKTKRQSAMLVSPYDHGDSYDASNSLAFANGKRSEAFGNHYARDWFDNIRTGKPLAFEKGVITYYRAFKNAWESDFYATATNETIVPLGEETRSFRYDPLNPPAFAAEGNFLQGVDGRPDVITLYTPPFEKDLFVKGKMKAVLSVASNCPDSSFYVCISIEKPQGNYVLRHDITSLCYQHPDYTPNRTVQLDFCFDEHAFLLKRDERLRVDIASTDNNTYVCHTNQKGPYHLQTETRVATNTVHLQQSRLILPTEIK